MGFGVWGLGFGVWGLGFGVWGLGFEGDNPESWARRPTEAQEIVGRSLGVTYSFTCFGAGRGVRV